MAQQLLKAANETRQTWWDALKFAMRLRGYRYYKPPPEFRYRFPAPGSEDNFSYQQNLHKDHWKNSFRESDHNVRTQLNKKDIWAEEHIDEYIVGSIPTWDENDPEGKIIKEKFYAKTWTPLTVDETLDLPAEEKRKLILQGIEEIQERRKQEFHWATQSPDHVHTRYEPFTMIWYERCTFGGIENDAYMKHLQLSTQDLANSQISDRYETMKLPVYKGTVKKWQVLDDAAHDREQIDKVQAAIRAPLADELEMYQEKHSKPLQLPFNNANVSKWRDEPVAADSADFDPQLIEYDKEVRKRYFVERFDRPKELTE